MIPEQQIKGQLKKTAELFETSVTKSTGGLVVPSKVLRNPQHNDFSCAHIKWSGHKLFVKSGTAVEKHHLVGAVHLAPL